MAFFVTTLIGLILLVTPAQAQTTRYVDISGNDQGGASTCFSSEAPCRTIAQAVNVASAGDIVQIAGGAYTESISLDKQLVLQGAGEGITIVQAHTEPAAAGARVFHVTGNSPIVIADLTIRHGIGAGFGGGILNTNSSLTLRNVTLSDNIATYGGGGMANSNSSPTLINVTFTRNRTGGSAGGGGLYNLNSSPTLLNLTFSGNWVSGTGGGGAIANENGSPTLIDVTLAGNTADGSPGGGIYNEGSSPILTNVVFLGNSAPAGGGMYNTEESAPVLTNVSFAGNTAAGGGGGMFSFNSSVTVRNSVFWNNRDGSGLGTADASIANASSDVTIYYSLVQGCMLDGFWDVAICGTDGGGNLEDQDPLFVEDADPDSAPTEAGDLRLQANSPAIDRGDPDTDLSLFRANNEEVPADREGNLRVSNGRIDLGAYEFQVSTTNLENRELLPTLPRLYQNYPNPFNPATVISYTLAEPGHVRLAVYDMLGRRMAVLLDGMRPAGGFESRFDAGDLPGGIYLYRLQTETFILTGKMTLVR